MIDPKSGGDYPWIERLPHLDGGLVTSQEAAMETFKDLVAEMEDRKSREAVQCIAHDQDTPPLTHTLQTARDRTPCLCEAYAFESFYYRLRSRQCD